MRYASQHLTLFLLCLVTLAHCEEALASSSTPSSVTSSPLIQQPSKTESTADVTTLELGKPVDRELVGLQEHGYQVTLYEGQYASVVVEQRGIDALVQLVGADGKSIVDFDSEIRIQGEERIELVAPATGSYRLLVKAKYPKFPAGRYEIRLVEVRNAAGNDRLLDEACRLRAAAWRLRMADNFAEAFPLAEKALELQERVLGPEHSELAYTLYLLAEISRFKVEYTKAEAFYLRGQRIAEISLGPDHPLVARFLNALARHYFDASGDYNRTEPLYQRALAIREGALGADHPDFAQSLTGLGFLLTIFGDLTRAETVLQRALLIYEKAFGEENVDVVSMLGSLAGVYTSKGDYLKAEPLYQRTLNYYEKTFGPNHGWVAIGLNNLASLYFSMKDYERAEPLIQRALSINESNGPDHPVVGRNRADLGLIYYSMGDYRKAEALYLIALPILEKALGPNHRLVGKHLSQLAKVYIALNDYVKAEPLSRRALFILEAAGGPTYHSLADVLLGLARMSVAQGKFAEAVAFQARANSIIEYNLNINLATGSERQKLAYLATLPEQLNRAISLYVRSAEDDPTARELAATSILQRKGRLQDALSNSLASLRDRFSAEDRALLDQLNAVTSQLARLILSEPRGMSLAEHQKKIKDFEEQREKLENEVSHRSAGFYQRSQTISLAVVRPAIPHDAALIEFAVYRPFDPKANNAKAYGEPRYVAYVIRNQGEVRWADLGEAKDVNYAIAGLRQALRNPQRSDVRQLARALDEKVMQPVRALVGAAPQLLVSPDGELNLIPFEALIDEQGKYLVERYAFTYLTSGRDLLRMQVARESKGKATVVANPSFGEPAQDQIAKTSAPMKPAAPGGRRRSVTAARSLSEVYFAPLGGSAREASAIKSLFPETNLFTEARATEEALKGVTGPRLLHVATHGFFLENSDAVVTNPRASNGNEQSVPGAVATGSVAQATTRAISANAKIENPLLRSGLALAGANLRGGASSDDGILTALEATGLNLWGTKLVVLSACDTGLGEVRNGEGVYGLRRAFVLAGAESLVMSLWPVSDYSTRTLMTNYYQNLKQGMGRGAALREVQLSMLRHRKQLHPFYWANFIQSGEWANLDGKR